jgi:hypothetical protein
MGQHSNDKFPRLLSTPRPPSATSHGTSEKQFVHVQDLVDQTRGSLEIEINDITHSGTPLSWSGEAGENVNMTRYTQASKMT